MNSMRDLRIVAWIFIISGIGCLVAPFVTGRIEIGTGLLGIPAGIGLLRFRAGWRIFALITLWAGFAVLLAGAAALLFAQHTSINLLGWRPESRWAFAAFLVPVFFVTLWQYRVLTRAEVRGQFERGGFAAV
jgi:hypothetical protein